MQRINDPTNNADAERYKTDIITTMPGAVLWSHRRQHRVPREIADASQSGARRRRRRRRALPAKHSFLPSDANALISCLAAVQRLFTSSKSVTEYTIFFAFLDEWHKQLRDIVAPPNQNAGLLVQMLSIALILDRNQLRDFFYHDFYIELNRLLQNSGTSVDNTNRKPPSVDAVEVVYASEGGSKRNTLVNVIKESIHSHDVSTATDGNDPVAKARRAVSNNHMLSTQALGDLLGVYDTLQTENEQLRRMIGDMKRAIRGIIPPKPLELSSKGCGTAQKVADIIVQVQEYFGSKSATASVQRSFHDPEPGHMPSKRVRSAYGDHVEGTTSPLFRMHQE
jgi:hypothetical protein